MLPYISFLEDFRDLPAAIVNSFNHLISKITNISLSDRTEKRPMLWLRLFAVIFVLIFFVAIFVLIIMAPEVPRALPES